MDARIADFLTSIGLGAPVAWPVTLAWAAGWLVLMLVVTPVAGWIAARLAPGAANASIVYRAPASAFGLIGGILFAWIVGGLIEETVLRGIILRWAEYQAACRAGLVAGVAGGIGAAAVVAGIVHLYQGPRTALVVAQLSALFGGLYILSGYDLWAAVICHGLYDTVALIRFAMRKTKAAGLEPMP